MFAVIALSLFHFGPGVFVATLLFINDVDANQLPAPLLTVVGLYLLAVLGLSIFEISKQKYNHTLLLIPFYYDCDSFQLMVLERLKDGSLI